VPPGSRGTWVNGEMSSTQCDSWITWPKMFSATARPTAVQLSVDAGRVTLTADSRAEPGSVARPGTGLGVISMRERAESLGGSFEAGPGGQGWLVRATLPLDASLRAAP